MISISSKVRSFVSGRRKNPHTVVRKYVLPQKNAYEASKKCQHGTVTRSLRIPSQGVPDTEKRSSSKLTVFPLASHAVGLIKYGSRMPPMMFAK